MMMLDHILRVAGWTNTRPHGNGNGNGSAPTGASSAPPPKPISVVAPFSTSKSFDDSGDVGAATEREDPAGELSDSDTETAAASVDASLQDSDAPIDGRNVVHEALKGIDVSFGI